MSNSKILVNEITQYTNSVSRILIGLATVGTASDGQLVRLCLNLSDSEEYQLYLGKREEEKYKEVLATAEKLLKIDGYLGKETDVKLPKLMGGGITNAWYLTEKGLAKTKIIDEYFTRYAVAGLPCGKRIERIPHEMVVTESFLKLVERQIVCDFIPERILKSQIMQRRHELRRQGINPDFQKETSGEETGDFKAVLLPKNDENAARFVVEGEAAIGYRGSQIASKPDKMLWFVTSKQQKEMVIETKKDRIRQVWIVGSVCLPFENTVSKKEFKKTISPLSGRGKLEKRIKEFLRTRVGAYTGRAVAGVLNEDFGNISRILSNLAMRDIIESEEIKLTPTKYKGRPNKLYWHTDNDEKINRTRNQFVKSLVISEAITFFTDKKYRMKTYTEASRILSFEPLEKQKYADLRVVIESPDVSIDELRKKIEAAKFGTSSPRIDVVIAVSTSERLSELSAICGQSIVFLTEKKSIIRPEKSASVTT